MRPRVTGDLFGRSRTSIGIPAWKAPAGSPYDFPHYGEGKPPDQPTQTGARHAHAAH
jgi:hypothetical protein